MHTHTHTQCRDFFPLSSVELSRESHWPELDFPPLAFCGHRKGWAAVLFNMSCPRLVFGHLHPLSLGLLEILLPCLGPDPQLNLLLPPVPLLTNYSGPLMRTSEILFPFISRDFGGFHYLKLGNDNVFLAFNGASFTQPWLRTLGNPWECKVRVLGPML